MQKNFDAKYGKGKFESYLVEDFAKPGVYDEALKGGVAGVIHLAGVLTLSPNPSEVVEPTIEGNISLLRSISAAGTIKRFVGTSSMIAQSPPRKGSTYEVKETDWNEIFPPMISTVHQLEIPDFDKALLIYAVGKILGEKAIWEFVEREKPEYAVNTVLPHMTWGKPFIPSEKLPSTADIPIRLFKNDKTVVEWSVQSWVDVQDTATILVQALLDSGVANRRIPAMAGNFNWDLLLETFRSLYPNLKDTIPGNFDNTATKLTMDCSIAERLLRRGGKKPGEEWESLESTLRSSVEGLPNTFPLRTIFPLFIKCFARTQVS